MVAIIGVREWRPNRRCTPLPLRHDGGFSAYRCSTLAPTAAEQKQEKCGNLSTGPRCPAFPSFTREPERRLTAPCPLSAPGRPPRRRFPTGLLGRGFRAARRERERHRQGQNEGGHIHHLLGEGTAAEEALFLQNVWAFPCPLVTHAGFSLLVHFLQERWCPGGWSGITLMLVVHIWCIGKTQPLLKGDGGAR